MHEYGMSLQYVMDELPLCQAFALHSAICARHDVPMRGPSYIEQEMLAALASENAETLKS